MDIRGQALTVLGPVSPDSLGVILPHEHLLVDMTAFITQPNYGPSLTDLEMTSLSNMGKIRQYPFAVKSNLMIDSEAEMIEELKLFKQAGGGTVCNLFDSGGPLLNTSNLPHMSRASGVHIVCGTGHYLDAFISEEVRMMGEEELSDAIVKDIMEGIGSPAVRCGIIGEVSCSWPTTATERKMLRAAARAQKQTGAPVNIHPGFSEESPFQILDILEEAGGDISRTVISHLDRTITDDDVLLKLAKRGCYLEYDMFGNECSNYQWGKVDLINDAQRIQKIKMLIENGFTHQILISQDICTKHRQVRYGGHGYGHILEYVAPKMEDRGIPADVVKTIITENPKNWLTFV